MREDKGTEWLPFPLPSENRSLIADDVDDFSDDDGDYESVVLEEDDPMWVWDAEWCGCQELGCIKQKAGDP